MSTARPTPVEATPTGHDTGSRPALAPGNARGAVTPRAVANLQPTEAGVDTAKVVSYVAHDRSIRALRYGQPTKATAGGAILVLGDDGDAEWPLPGARTLFYPATSLLAVEGHPSGQKGVLARGDDLPGWWDDLREAFHLRGVEVDGRVGVARCDGTVTGSCTPQAGAAVLAGVASIVPPRFKVETYRSRRAIETVYYVTENGRKRARAYDAASVHELAEPLSRIRFEDQRQYDRQARRPDASTVTTANVRDAFRDRWGTLLKATKGVHVTTIPVAVDRLGVMYETGELTWSKAERAAGALLLLRSGARPAERTMEWRRRKELAELGLVLVEGELEEVDVDLSAAVEAMVEESVW
jgi:hypothetical protein